MCGITQTIARLRIISFVAGGYLWASSSIAVRAEPRVQPLNQSVIFLRDRDVILSSDVWQVALNLNLSAYEDVLATLKSDWEIISKHQGDSTSLSELRQVETLLESLESKLGQFRQLFPRVEPKRSLLNLGGTVLRTLFGTATLTDLHRLHEAMNVLKDSNAEIAHSLSKQVTYIRDLNTVTNVNNEALVNLSTIVKDNVVQSHAKFQETSRDISWLNETLRHHSLTYIRVRQLEYSLMMAVHQIGELFSSVQYALLGKLPVSLVTPVTLHRILTDVSLNLPENYELVAGVKIQDIHTYYELIKVALVGNAHGAQLVIQIPLKTATQAFSLFKIIVFPTKLSHDSFLKFKLDHSYFGLAVDQRDYILLTGADLQRCATGSITVCPAEIPVYHTQLMTCEGSLYFQSPDSFHLCRKDLLRHYRTPALIHHGSQWAYHFPEHRQVTIRCPQEEGQYSRTVSLVGGGLIHNASACHISTQEVRTIPVLSKTAERDLDAPLLFLPDGVPELPSHEVAKLVEALPPETSELDFVKERLVTPRQAFDVDTLLHVQQRSAHASQESHVLRLALYLTGSVIVTLLLAFACRSHLGNLLGRCGAVKADPSPIAAPRVTPASDAMLELMESGRRTLDTQDPVTFASYALSNAPS